MKGQLASSADPVGEVRVILARLVAGVEQDLAGLPDRASDRIHEIRVRMKKFRALLAMLSGGLTGRTFERADRLARDVKDHFSSSRDTEVLRELLLDLLNQPEAISVAGGLGLPNAEEGPVSADPAVRATCRELGQMVINLRLSGQSWPLLFDGWVTTYRSARKTMKLCSGNEDDFLFHEWRKRIKELLYQSSVLCEFDPAAEIIPGAERLASLLGKHHDLALLHMEFSEKLPDHRAARIVHRKKHYLARSALKLGARLLAEKPSTLRRRLAKR